MGLKIALLQPDTIWEDRPSNLRRAAALIEEAARRGCAIALLPEMFSTGYTMDPRMADPEGSSETDSFLRQASASNGIGIVAGFGVVSMGGPKGRNIARAYDRQGRPIATYTKQRPFVMANEGLFFEAGEEASVFSIEGLMASVFICFDLRFPELFRPVAPEVDAMFVLANWPSSRKGHWEGLLRARAIENQCFVAGVNRTGTDGNGIAYAGGSLVFGPSGELLLSAGPEEGVFVAEIDPAEVRRVRAEFPFLKEK